MKKTRWIVLLRDIRKTWVSFLSIIVFVSLGVAIFLGIKWNEPALSQAMDRYLDEHRYHDLQMVFPYGFTEDDAAAVAALDGVSAVEGAYNAYGTAQVGGDRCILNIQSLTDTMDHAEVLEGELPAAADEVAVERLLAEALELHLGDTLPISALRGGKPCLKNSEFTITPPLPARRRTTPAASPTSATVRQTAMSSSPRPPLTRKCMTAAFLSC